jgi:hypothetical protein
LGDRLIAAYALGSLAHGGFSPLVSDVDLGLIVADPAGHEDEVTIRRVADAQKARGSELHERLSVFWGTPCTLRGETDGGRFPPLDRLDLVDNGRLLAGTDAREGLPRPEATELLVAGARFALEFLAGAGRRAEGSGKYLGSLKADVQTTEEIRSPDLLVARGVRSITKVVLFPVRFLFSASTGRVGTNDHAVEHYLEDHEAPARALVAAAKRWRTAAPDEREAAELLGRELVALYLHYIEDHVERLRAVGEDELADAFLQWRDRLRG